MKIVIRINAKLLLISFAEHHVELSIPLLNRAMEVELIILECCFILNTGNCLV
ncbi:MAG: hypothetical protein WBM83_16415 [Flavobacteriaceae bacterium]